MSGIRIDYSDLSGMVDEGRKQSGQRKARRSRLIRFPWVMLKWAVGLVILAVILSMMM